MLIPLGQPYTKSVAYISDKHNFSNGINFVFQIRGFTGKGVAESPNTVWIASEAGGMGSLENTQTFGKASYVNESIKNIISILSAKYHYTGLVPNSISLVSFSGGYGAIEKILSEKSKLVAPIKSVTVLDGIHEGSKTPKAWIDWAKESQNDPSKSFNIVHTNIKPPNYASTTDSADNIINNLGLKRENGNVISGGFKVFNIGGQDAQAHMNARDFLTNLEPGKPMPIGQTNQPAVNKPQVKSPAVKSSNKELSSVESNFLAALKDLENKI